MKTVSLDEEAECEMMDGVSILVFRHAHKNAAGSAAAEHVHVYPRHCLQWEARHAEPDGYDP